MIDSCIRRMYRCLSNVIAFLEGEAGWSEAKRVVETRRAGGRQGSVSVQDNVCWCCFITLCLGLVDMCYGAWCGGDYEPGGSVRVLAGWARRGGLRGSRGTGQTWSGWQRKPLMND